MPVKRYENDIQSEVKAIVLYTGTDVGLVGPRFMVQTMSDSQIYPLEHISSYLNDSSGRNGKLRVISKSLETQIVDALAEELVLKGGVYLFNESINPEKKTKAQCDFYSSFLKEKENRSQLDVIKSIKSISMFGNISEKESTCVSQRQYAITSSISNKPIICSYGAGPCIIIAAYNPSSKVGFLAHADSSLCLNSLRKLFMQVTTDLHDGEKLQVHLYGGTAEETKFAADLLKLIKSIDNVEIKSAHLCKNAEDYSLEKKSSDRLALDVRTGAVYDQFDASQFFHKDDDYLSYLSVSIGLGGKAPLSQIFDGRKSRNTNQHN